MTGHLQESGRGIRAVRGSRSTPREKRTGECRWKRTRHALPSAGVLAADDNHRTDNVWRSSDGPVKSSSYVARVQIHFPASQDDKRLVNTALEMRPFDLIRISPEQEKENSNKMAPAQDRIAILEGRCSPFALELLDQLRDHHLFPALVTGLERLRGPLFRVDVEQMFTALAREYRKDEQ